jgi:hypothetical protein
MLKHLFGAPIVQNKISEADHLLARFETQFPCKSSSQQQEIATYETISRSRDQKKPYTKTFLPNHSK